MKLYDIEALNHKSQDIIVKKESLKWYALYTNPRAEKKVKMELDLNGFENYLPLQKTIRQWSDRKKMVEVPLFNSYIFVKINLEKSFQHILSINGIVKFIKFGNEIASIRDSQINNIKLILSNFEGIEVTGNHQIEPGQEVEVIAGYLKGSRGKVIEKKGTRYFSVEIEQIGVRLLISIPAQYLKDI